MGLGSGFASRTGDAMPDQAGHSRNGPDDDGQQSQDLTPEGEGHVPGLTCHLGGRIIGTGNADNEHPVDEAAGKDENPDGEQKEWPVFLHGAAFQQASMKPV